MANKFGVRNALSTLKAHVTTTGWTVESWLRHHVEHLTGVDPNTIAKYKTYIRNDIAESLGAIPLAALSREHVSVWIKAAPAITSAGILAVR